MSASDRLTLDDSPVAFDCDTLHEREYLLDCLDRDLAEALSESDAANPVNLA